MYSVPLGYLVDDIIPWCQPALTLAVYPKCVQNSRLHPWHLTQSQSQSSTSLLTHSNAHLPLLHPFAHSPKTSPINQSSPKLSRTHRLTRRPNPFRSSLHSRPASTSAGLSSFGSPSMLITDNNIVTGVCTGLHRSFNCSYPYLSSSGGCRMLIQTSPDG
jgi:hypothetical protein